MQPFSNYSQTVSPNTKELIISFDKALNTQDCSMFYGPDGQDHFPMFVGEPEFLPGNQSIKLRLTLKPEWKYSFRLPSVSFRNMDDQPLEDYDVEGYRLGNAL
jgi:hypothetical protein